MLAAKATIPVARDSMCYKSDPSKYKRKKETQAKAFFFSPSTEAEKEKKKKKRFIGQKVYPCLFTQEVKSIPL